MAGSTLVEPDCDVADRPRVGHSEAFSAADVTVIARRRGWAALEVRELWRYRELLYFLTWRDIRVRYKQTLLGAAWAVLQPLAAMSVFSIVLGGLAQVPSEGVPYPLFVYAGLLPWLFFASVVAQAGQSVVSQAHLVTRVYFPRLLLPTATAGPALVDCVLGLAVYGGLLAWYGRAPTPGVCLLPAVVALNLMVALGVGYLAASATVRYRDLRHVLNFALPLWMFATPVVYPLSLADGVGRRLLELNPMTGIVQAYRGMFLGSQWDVSALAVSAVSGAGLLVLGAWNFTRVERRMADEI